MPASGRALRVFDAPLFDVDDMIGRLDVADTPADNIIDYMFGTGTVYPLTVTIDYTWLVQPVSWRPVPPANALTVTQQGAGSTLATNTTSINEYGAKDPGDITVETNQSLDTQSLATYITTWQGNYLQRPPQLTVDLLQRTTTEIWTILSVGEGTRITLTNTPATWPAQCLSVFVEGVAHVVGLDSRRAVWSCSPLIGQAAGQVGPWFKLGTSLLNGSDVAPF